MLSGAFGIARLIGREVDEGPCRQQLAHWAEEARAELRGAGTMEERLRAFASYLYGRLGFHPLPQSLHEPLDSSLPDVMARRTGLPILLSLVYCEVGRGAGLDLRGVGMPGHFIVEAADPAGRRWLVDAYGNGRRLSVDDCAATVASVLGPDYPFDPEVHLLPSTDRETLVRMLTNLKAGYVGEGQWEMALAMSEAIVVLDRAATRELRDQGGLLDRLQRYDLALGAYRRYLDAAPDAPDRTEVDRRILVLEVLRSP